MPSSHPHPPRAAYSGRRGSWRTSLGTLPGIGIALVPGCPACWPLYASVASALGVGAGHAAFRLSLTVGFVALAVGVLAYRARSRRGYGPVLLGAIAAGLVLLGKLLWFSNPVAYAGGALLVSATLWNAWPRTSAGADTCPTCPVEGSTSRCGILEAVES